MGKPNRPHQALPGPSVNKKSLTRCPLFADFHRVFAAFRRADGFSSPLPPAVALAFRLLPASPLHRCPAVGASHWIDIRYVQCAVVLFVCRGMAHAGTLGAADVASRYPLSDSDCLVRCARIKVLRDVLEPK